MYFLKDENKECFHCIYLIVKFSYIGNPSNTKGMDLHNQCNVNNN